MKYLFAFALALSLVVMPVSVSAHEVQQFEINGEHYEFVVGSLNEPVTVDDKTGVYLHVREVGHVAGGEADHHAAAGALAGLEETLQVEISAGTEKKVLALSPIHDEPGAYRASFYPTVATTYSYRFFGTIEETPVDLAFTCSQAGHAVAEEDTKEVVLSEGVTRISKTGAFGCPAPKEDLGFPEPAVTMTSLRDDVAKANTLATGAMGVAVLAILGMAYIAMRKK
ncbi:MAG: hypothetical protein AB199_01790 [Parcubacteria bacterium C7867-004]|nr:MAG: hypothetical protein AB199_01790 [Parcubacteria bacterium C7867-004]